MIYTLFFLLGLPIWLIASARILRSETQRPLRKMAWAGVAFIAPLAIFGLASVVSVLMDRQSDEAVAWARGVGYLLVAVKLFAFFSPFVVSSVFESRDQHALRKG